MKKRLFRNVLRRTLAALYARRAIAGAALLAAARAAHAGGGLNAGTQAANNFTLWLYGFCGILAGSYLLWVGLQCWSNKADWIHDFGGGIAKVASVGAALVLAGWAFGLFA